MKYQLFDRQRLALGHISQLTEEGWNHLLRSTRELADRAARTQLDDLMLE